MADNTVPRGYDSTSKPPKIKNKNPAPVQITAEQLLREVQERKEPIYKPPEQKLQDKEEIAAYQMRKRKEYEDSIRRNRINIGTWIRYASARSIYERALDVDSGNQTIFLKYTEMEMKNKNINLARNLFDRAVTILPRVNQFWLKYTYMEELLGNIIGARQIFERWMKWEPDETAWNAFIKFERRYQEYKRAENIMERFVFVHPEPKNWIKWAELAESNGNIDRLGKHYLDQRIFIAFAKFETKLREYGDQDEIEFVVLSKRRQKYKKILSESPHDYRTWIDLTQLEESVGDVNIIRETYSEAVSNIPTTAEKHEWKKFIYLYLFFAIFEEVVAKDTERARKVYLDCLDTIPHKKFTFSKVWLQYALFEIRHMRLKEARLALGRSLGMCPKDKLFRGYIELELQLREFDRVRVLYNKQLEFNPNNSTTWIEFAKMEALLGETERCQTIYELAIDQLELDMPELVWKSYIDFEVSEGNYGKVRELYEKLLKKSDHIKVWISYVQFECTIADDLPASENTDEPEANDSKPALSERHIQKARAIFERAYNYYKKKKENKHRVSILEAWRNFELEHGDSESLERIDKLQPNKVKKRRELEDGTWEEYIDYIFPDDQDQMPNIKLLEMARQWKLKMADSEPTNPDLPE
ncbi:hypothetical protein BB560_003726 [Smittium megazygosporum]|uniref:Suppressor of forked domain-containing protein n=1 Tax=Smittium megazygosporum TaxID=133381 RepID=A0A2T9ZB72_9FUNG|nr:hypothetical protein BB560_003726 [Smittium megazygosporum]